MHTLRLQAKEYLTSLHFGADLPEPSLLDDAISRCYCLFIQVEIERWNLERSSKNQKGIYTEQNKKVYRYWAVCFIDCDKLAFLCFRRHPTAKCKIN